MINKLDKFQKSNDPKLATTMISTVRSENLTTREVIQ